MIFHPPRVAVELFDWLCDPDNPHPVQVSLPGDRPFSDIVNTVLGQSNTFLAIWEKEFSDIDCYGIAFDWVPLEDDLDIRIELFWNTDNITVGIVFSSEFPDTYIYTTTSNTANSPLVVTVSFDDQPTSCSHIPDKLADTFRAIQDAYVEEDQ